MPLLYTVLDEMVSRGNLIAKYLKSELQQLETNLQMLPVAPENPSPGLQRSQQGSMSQSNAWYPGGMANATGEGLAHQISPDYLGEWNSEDGLSGDQLTALADYLDFEHLDWLGPEMFQPLDPTLRL